MVRFKWKPHLKIDDQDHLGIIAEEAPSTITNADHSAVSTPDYLAFLTAGLKALKAENDALKVEQAMLNTRLEKLEPKKPDAKPNTPVSK